MHSYSKKENDRTLLYFPLKKMGRHESIFEDASQGIFNEKYRAIFTPILGKQLAVNTYYENDLIAPANTRISIKLLQVFDELKISFKVNKYALTDEERNHALDSAMAQLIRSKRNFFNSIRQEDIPAIQDDLKVFINQSLTNHQIKAFHDHFQEVKGYLEFAASVITSDKKYIGTAAALKKIVENERRLFGLGDDYVGETIDHSIKTSWLSLILAEKSDEFSEEDYKRLSVICLGHDSGKALIPESIIYKNGRLSQLENDIMKSHVLLSYIMMSNNQQFFEFEAFVMAMHHTKENKKLSQSYSIAHDVHTSFYEYLTPAAKSEFKKIYASSKKYYRVISIADTFEAISAERVYKKASSIGKALDIMIRSNEKEDFFYKPYLDRFVEIIIKTFLPPHLLFEVTDELMEHCFDNPFSLPEPREIYKKNYKGVIIKSCSTIDDKLKCVIYNKLSNKIERKISVSPNVFSFPAFFLIIKNYLF